MGVSYKAISLDALEGEVVKLVAEHIDSTRDEVRKHVQKAGKAASDELKEVSPKLTGEYAAGWRYKTEDEGLDTFSATVYNSAKPWLVHLLEYGHGLVYFGNPTGKFVPPKPHLDKGYQAGAKELMK